jgi:hypothetical protein
VRHGRAELAQQGCRHRRALRRQLADLIQLFGAAQEGTFGYRAAHAAWSAGFSAQADAQGWPILHLLWAKIDVRAYQAFTDRRGRLALRFGGWSNAPSAARKW